MADTDSGFGVGLWDLHWAGTDKVPTLAKIFADANGAVSRTFEVESKAFPSVEPILNESATNRYKWEAFRDDFQRLLFETAETLDMLGEALCLCVKNYVESDDAAAAAFRREAEEHAGDEPHPVEIPPLKMP